MPTFVKVIITVLLFALGAFSIYGLTGLDFKEEKPSKARQIAVLISYFMILGGISLFGYLFIRNPRDSEEYEDDIKASYQDGYTDGYADAEDEWSSYSYQVWEENYKKGYEDALSDYNVTPSP